MRLRLAALIATAVIAIGGGVALLLLEPPWTDGGGDAVLGPTPPPAATPVSGAPCPGGPAAPFGERPVLAYAAPDDTIWVASADGTSATQLICTSTGPRNASWSPSGKYLAHVGGAGSLRILDVETGEDAVVEDGSQGTLLRRGNVRVGPTTVAYMGWSAADDTLLYQKFDKANLPVYWVVTVGEAPSALLSDSAVRGVALSPDGRRVLYVLPNEFTPLPFGGRTAQIFLMNVDGTGNEKLADGIYPSWSPDGRLVAYWTEDRGGSSFIGDIVIIDVDTRVSVWLGEFTSDESPAWSPDPRRNVFHNMAVYAANAKDATATPIFDRPAEIVGWSSGGTKVAYVDGSAFGRGPRSLVLLDTVSGRQETVHTSNADTAHALGSGYRGVWSPDGRYYAYSAVESIDDDGGVVVFYVTDTESGTTNRLWEGTVLDSISAVYSPDGSKLLLEIDVDRSPSVWLANADGTALSEVAAGQMLRPPWRPAAD